MHATTFQLLSGVMANTDHGTAQVLFPFGTFWWLYAGFTAFVLLVLALDLGVFHRSPHEVRFREAAAWSAAWVALALLFNLGLWWFAGWELADPGYAGVLKDLGYTGPADAAGDLGLEFLAGYLIEKSLSVDNVFVFVVIFRFFAVPAKYQHRVLFFGILGALVSRAIFIALGTLLLQFNAVVWLFGAFLVFTGVKLLFTEEQGGDLSDNRVLRIVRRLLPVTQDFHGQRFWVRVQGALHATPLLVALIVVEATDIIFAVDSVPAIFAVTREPLVVFTSNIFAILGLRSLYFMLAGAMGSFRFLHYGLGLVLMFVGVKMVLPLLGVHVHTGVSLGVICGVIGASIGASLLFPKGPVEHPSKSSDAGSDS